MPPIPPPESALRLVPEHPLEGVAIRSVLDELRVDVLVHVAALDALDPEAEVLEHDDAALPLAALPASPLGEPADLVDAHLLRHASLLRLAFLHRVPVDILVPAEV